MELLLSHGADVHTRNENGCHAAHWAAAGGCVDVLELLLRVCEVDDLTRPNNAGHTPLEHAVAYGRRDSADWFVSRGLVDWQRHPRALWDSSLAGNPD